MSERVVVAMSGGVDSSVAAALLVEQGFDVIGVTLRLVGDSSRCCSLDDAEDARRVAERLGIRFYVGRLQRRLPARGDGAVRRRLSRGPHADSLRRLQSALQVPPSAGALARTRRRGGGDGHYARIERDPASGALALLRGSDPRKDQSYFLFDLRPEQLAQIRFPVGALAKHEVRERARALGLATADKPESQELCFVPDGNTAAAVERLRPVARRARAKSSTKRAASSGRHAGIHRFTVGQRRGLAIALGERVYVKAIDATHNA